jgi:quercetin dioxygenase-like cupin family protein
MSTEVRDVVEADPQHYTVEFENERVRVLRIRYGPGEKSVMHSHPASVTIFLTDIYARFTYPDGQTEEPRGQAGQVLWEAPVTHLPENLSDQPFEVLQIELRG